MSDKQSHLVVVSQHYPPDKSGNASRISDTCTHLADEGWDVTVLAPPPAFPHGQFERTWRRKTTQEEDDVTAHRLWGWQPTTEDPSFLSRMAYYIFFPMHALLWLLINYREYDAIVTSSPPIFTGLAGLPFGVLDRKTWIVDVRDLWIDASIGLGFISEGGILEQVSRIYEGLVLKKADRVAVTTNVLGEKLYSKYGIDQSKIIHLPNGVDTTTYEPMPIEREQTIVYTGNVGHAQDLEACILAMDILEESEATLKIVGDGDIKKALEDLVRDKDLGDSVEFTGLLPRNEIPPILNKSRIGLAPLKKSETLEYAVPTKVYEYMAMELPVVATGVGELEHLLEDSEGGVLVDNDPQELAGTFEILLNNDEKHRALGTAGRQYILDHYDRRSIAKTLDSELEHAIEVDG